MEADLPKDDDDPCPQKKGANCTCDPETHAKAAAAKDDSCKVFAVTTTLGI
jgi:hypothetical protein